jgi:hypothetical protein
MLIFFNIFHLFKKFPRCSLSVEIWVVLHFRGFALLLREDFFYFLVSFLNPSYLIFSLWMKLCTLWFFSMSAVCLFGYACKAVVIPFMLVFQRTLRVRVNPQYHHEDSQLQFRVGLLHFITLFSYSPLVIPTFFNTIYLVKHLKESVGFQVVTAVVMKSYIWKASEVSEEYAASIFRIKNKPSNIAVWSG